VIEDEYREQAVRDTNQAWAYPLDSDQSGLERDQAKWEYAVAQRAGRLRAEAALLHITKTLAGVLDAGQPLIDLCLRSLRDVKLMMFPPDTPPKTRESPPPD
jgi:hypothetical protein